MRAMKRIFSMLAAACMAVVLCIPAMAATGDPGKITIDNAVKDKTYTIYRVFDLETNEDANPTAYKYTLSEKWKGLETENDFATYFTVDETDGHLVKAKTFNAANFAAFLNTYQKDNKITNDGFATAENGSVTFTDLPLGYYFVQTDLGSLCSLDTTNPTATIKEKNAEPTVDKQVQEGNAYGDTNDASIGDTVNFKTTIDVVDGDPKNYVLHDIMSDGLTFNSETGITSVTVNGAAITARVSETDRYYELVSTTTDSCTFEVKFYNLKPNDVIVVYYSATLNEKAIVAGSGNSNGAWLKYGDDGETAHDKTTTYTWEMPIFKYTGTDTALAGAKFKLYTDGSCTEEVGLIYDNILTAYRPVKTGETATVVTSADNGKISIKGLNAGTYYLKETKAPAGYNMLEEPIKVVISSAENTTDKTRTSSMTQDGEQASQIGVKNETGPELPSTGGIGTTVFYVVGGIMVAGAAILLITKKRMNRNTK